MPNLFLPCNTGFGEKLGVLDADSGWDGLGTEYEHHCVDLTIYDDNGKPESCVILSTEDTKKLITALQELVEKAEEGN